ncbi:hypothetical protein D3C81_1731820 [compost metagenome]
MCSGRDHSGFALDRLEHDRHGPFIHRRVKRREIIEGNAAEARKLRLETVDQGRAVRRRNRPQATTMASLVGHDDPRSAAAVPLPPFARQLDRRFARLAAAVEQVRLIAASAVTQALGEIEHAAVMQAETGIDQRLRLRGNGTDQCLGAVAEAVGAAALGEIQIRAVIAVP